MGLDLGSLTSSPLCHLGAIWAMNGIRAAVQHLGEGEGMGNVTVGRHRQAAALRAYGPPVSPQKVSLVSGLRGSEGAGTGCHSEPFTGTCPVCGPKSACLSVLRAHCRDKV